MYLLSPHAIAIVCRLFADELFKTMNHSYYGQLHRHSPRGAIKTKKTDLTASFSITLLLTIVTLDHKPSEKIW